MANVEVILTENIRGLGAEADLVKVRPGYARNFLIPQKKAHEVNPGTLRNITFLKKKRAEREASELNGAEELARKINKLRITMTLETGATGKAFGSITSHDIHTRLKAEIEGLELDRHDITLERPIKETGEHEIPIRIHTDVIAKLQLNVKSAGDETAAAAADEEGEGTKGKTRKK